MANEGTPFNGEWRIVEMEQWDADCINLIVPGHFTFEADGMGFFQFGTVRGDLDCRFERVGEGRRVEFSWEGESDTDPGCGRGWAMLKDDELRGRIYIHASDDSAFRAVRAKNPRRKGAG
jgi:hypothetical protein